MKLPRWLQERLCDCPRRDQASPSDADASPDASAPESATPDAEASESRAAKAHDGRSNKRKQRHGHARRSRRRRRLVAAIWWTAAISVTLVVMITSLDSSTVRAAGRVFNDKLLHAFAYFVLSALWCQALARQWPRWPVGRYAGIVLAGTIWLGIALEGAQFFVKGRVPDVLDGFANVAGALIGVGLWATREVIDRRRVAPTREA